MVNKEFYSGGKRMIPKIEVDEVKKKRIITKAGHLGAGEIKKSYGA